MPPTSESPFTYRGHDILELLREARNYNGWLADQVLAACPKGAERTIDLGAGTGTFSTLVRQRGLNVECVEPDARNAELLRTSGFNVYEGLEQLPGSSVDYIFTLNVLEHVPDDRQLITRAHQCLRPGGKLFIFVPAFPILWSSLDDHVEHVRRYRRKPLVTMLQETGWLVESACYADSIGFFAALAFAGSGGELNGKQIALYDRVVFPTSLLLDRVVRRSFGKNLMIICKKDGTEERVR
jgi:SAM-dependent methyltransferase